MVPHNKLRGQRSFLLRSTVLLWHDGAMDQNQTPAIARLVAHHNGPTAVSNALGGFPTYQEVQRWVRRGWASPMHIFKLKPLLPRGMKLDDLAADRDRAKEAA